MRRYRHRVTVKAKTAVRGTSGGTTYTYEARDGMSNLAALVMPRAFEKEDPDKLPVTTVLKVLIAGDRDVQTEDVIEWKDTLYEVMVVQQTIGRRSTIVTCQEVRV